jgi:hypothetical protein
MYVEDRCPKVTGNELEWMGEEPTISDVTNGLIAVTPDRAYIHTGMEQGPAEARAQVFDQEPKGDLGGWDEVVEVSFTSTHGNAFLGTAEDSVDFNLAAQGRAPTGFECTRRAGTSSPVASSAGASPRPMSNTSCTRGLRRKSP